MAIQHRDIIRELQLGICEVTRIDTHSVEHVLNATLSTNHLDDWREQKNESAVTLWNVVEEEWQTIPAFMIIHVERLTGLGIKDESDEVSVEEFFDMLD